MPYTMKCDICDVAMERLKDQLHRYVESGLETVYLGGIDTWHCATCKVTIPIIPRLPRLHAEMAKAIALKQTPLGGAEARFLRKEAGYSSKAWAALLRLDVSTLSRMESGDQPIGKQTDALIRLLYFRLLEEKEARFYPEQVTRQIATIDQQEDRSGLLINAHSPGIYAYKPIKEIVASAR